MEIEPRNSFHPASLLYQPLRQGAAQKIGRGALKSQAVDLFIRKPPLLRTQMLPVCGSQGQHFQQQGIGLVYLLRTGTFRLGDSCIRLSACMGFPERNPHISIRALCLSISPGSIPGLESVTDFPVGFGIGGIVDPGIQVQHPPMFAAVVAPPHVLDKVDIHLSPPVAAERAVRIGTVRLSAPDMQMQQFHHVENAKREIL